MGWTFRIITNCFSVCICLLCVCLCMCVSICSCVRVSPEIDIGHLLLLSTLFCWDRLSYWTRKLPIYLDLIIQQASRILMSLLPDCDIQAQVITPGFVFFVNWELGLGIGLGSSRLLVHSSLLTELPPQSHYQRVQWLLFLLINSGYECLFLWQCANTSIVSGFLYINRVNRLCLLYSV